MVAIDRRELVALGALLALGAALLARNLGAFSLEFDEGVYLLSVDALGRGLELGRDVFSSQPPLFLGLLDVVNSLASGSAEALRGVDVGLALAGALAGWGIVRGIAGPFPALAATALVVLAPGVVDAAAVVSADVPSVALGTAALLAARMARRRAPWGAAAGALLCCALLVKLLAAPFAFAIAVGALVDRPSRAAISWFTLGLLAALAATAIAYWSVLGDLWREAVAFHLDAGAAARLPAAALGDQVALIAIAYMGLLATLGLGLSRIAQAELAGWARSRADLLAVFGSGLVLVLVSRPLIHHHFVVVAWPLALLAASSLPARISRRALAAIAVGLLLALPWAIRGRDTVEGAAAGQVGAIARVVRDSTDPGSRVVSDLPLVPVLADRRPAAETIDPSAVRVTSGSLDRGRIIAAAGRAQAAVVGRAFRFVPGLETALARRFDRVVEVGGARVYLR